MMPEPKEPRVGKCKTCDHVPNEDENEGGYYYDDAHGYQPFSPDEIEDDDDEAEGQPDN